MKKWVVIALCLLATTVTPIERAWAQAAPAPVTRTLPVGMPQDAGPHDSVSTIEWWYVNAYLTTESGHRYAVVGAFFRAGLSAQRKGHYLIYAIADLDSGTSTAYSLVDHATVKLLEGYLIMAATAHPDDPAPMKMLQMLQKGDLPAPHRALATAAAVVVRPQFSLTMGENRIAEASPDGRTWKVTLAGGDNRIVLTLSQPVRPPMSVGGSGLVGVDHPEDMYYLALTHMDAAGTITRAGKTEAVHGRGWLDRQWGRTWGIRRDIGWDWFGLHLTDDSDVIIYRLRNTATGATVQSLATREAPDGSQSTETPNVVPDSATYTDPATHIAFPSGFVVTLPAEGLTLHVTPRFAAQVLPVLTGGDAIWEGAVDIERQPAGGVPGAYGNGYMELVGYRPAPPPDAGKTTP
jgi:predicted secreted hydrolase